jgi:lactoylglutathione lyase
MEKSLHFYCDVLGMKKVFDLKRDSKPWIEYIKICDGQFIELFHVGEGDKPPSVKSGISYSHLCLLVSDIHAACEAVKKAGYPLDKEPSMGLDNNWQAWLVDPDGNRIELMQISPDSPHSKSTSTYKKRRNLWHSKHIPRSLSTPTTPNWCAASSESSIWRCIGCLRVIRSGTTTRPRCPTAMPFA